MPIIPNTSYVSHIILSHDAAEIAMDQNVDMVLKKYDEEYREKIKLMVFQDLLRRYEGEVWTNKD